MNDPVPRRSADSVASDSGCVTTKVITLDRLRERFEQPDFSLFAILDACGEPRVPAMANQLQDRAVSLFSDRPDQDYWAIAPYLADVDLDLFEWIVDQLWGTPWGVFLYSTQDLETLHKHFRRFLNVRGPDGKEMYFRYYDPRVLPAFLSSCDQVEAKSFFGPVSTLIAQSAGDALLEINLTSVS